MRVIARAPGSSPLRRLLRSVGPLLAALALSHCAAPYTLVSAGPGEVERHETFGFRKWLRAGTVPETVVIGIHGFCGASIDYDNLGRHLMKEQPETAVYAYELRGQGRDPLERRRGDIDDPELWFDDLKQFSRIVRQRHPRARVVWFGESMGALIAAHAYRRARDQGEVPPCDALVLSSPVVKMRDDFPGWKKELVRAVSKVVPTARVTLEALAGGQEVQMTHDTLHSEQAETNAWHIERHTLRLLVALGELIDGMPRCARSFEVPTLVLHGGKDFFSSDADVKAFYGSIPKSAGRSFRFYPDSYHLLMYDDQKEKVIGDVEGWLADLPAARRE